jgi:DNA end-binding protein Ku
MTGHRAQWKGFLKFGEVSCAVGLYTAASTSERISFHVVNKRTGMGTEPVQAASCPSPYMD